MILLLGGPGSGKGTQTEFLLKTLKGYSVFCMGNILREMISKNDELAQQIKAAALTGKLVEDHLLQSILEQKLTDNNIILDGFPRNLKQIQSLNDFCKFHETFNKNEKDNNQDFVEDKNFIEKDKKFTLDLIINLKIDLVEIKQRLLKRKQCRKCDISLLSNVEFCNKCGNAEFYQRLDDEDEIINRRIENYLKDNEKIEEFYKNFSCYYEINANQSILAVQSAIKDLLVFKNFDLIK